MSDELNQFNLENRSEEAVQVMGPPPQKKRKRHVRQDCSSEEVKPRKRPTHKVRTNNNKKMKNEEADDGIGLRMEEYFGTQSESSTKRKAVDVNLQINVAETATASSTTLVIDQPEISPIPGCSFWEPIEQYISISVPLPKEEEENVKAEPDVVRRKRRGRPPTVSRKSPGKEVTAATTSANNNTNRLQLQQLIEENLRMLQTHLKILQTAASTVGRHQKPPRKSTLEFCQSLRSLLRNQVILLKIFRNE